MFLEHTSGIQKFNNKSKEKCSTILGILDGRTAAPSSFKKLNRAANYCAFGVVPLEPRKHFYPHEKLGTSMAASLQLLTKLSPYIQPQSLQCPAAKRLPNLLLQG